MKMNRRSRFEGLFLLGVHGYSGELKCGWQTVQMQPQGSLTQFSFECICHEAGRIMHMKFCSHFTTTTLSSVTQLQTAQLTQNQTFLYRLYNSCFLIIKYSSIWLQHVLQPHACMPRSEKCEKIPIRNLYRKERNCKSHLYAHMHGQINNVVVLCKFPAHAMSVFYCFVRW